MDTRGQPRRGLGISLKMIVTTTLLIVLTVIGTAILNYFRLRESYDESAQAQIKIYRNDREVVGEFAAPMFARALQDLLANRGLDDQILTIASDTVKRDTKDVEGRTELGLRLAYILDQDRKLIAHCFEAPELTCTLGKHEEIPASLGKLTRESWAQSLAAWKAADPTATPLVRLDLEDGEQYRVFAYPIIKEKTPTAQLAALDAAPDDRLGYIVLAYDLTPTQWFAASAEGRKAEASKEAITYGLLVGALFAVIGTVLAIFQGLSISRPIKVLAYKVDQIARGDLQARVEIKSHDEIGVLGENFNYMADQLAILLQETADKARMEQELELVKAIQETLVPSSEPINLATLEFAGFYQPAAQTGGDWWTWHTLVGDKVLIVIGDVTGHGVPSAMITAAAKAACDVARHVHYDNVTVTKLLEIMNRAILESAQRRFAMTCFASVIDTKARTITYANAGHNLPYLVRGQGAELGNLTSRGNRLGDDVNSEYEAKTTQLEAGDMLVWYTDGVVENDNPAGEQYGERRFRMAIKKFAGMEAAAMRDELVQDAAEFYADEARKDDITMIVGRIK
jgi:serine phosphatase RsbU (regulator of sigma subunit)